MLSAITYSDIEFAFASCKQSARHFGIGISLFAAGVFRIVEITGLLCSDLHALRTDMYGVRTSKNTHSHCNARISSRRRPAYKPIIIKRYGGSPFTVSSRTATCWSVKASFFFDAFPPFAEIPTHGLWVIS